MTKTLYYWTVLLTVHWTHPTNVIKLLVLSVSSALFSTYKTAVLGKLSKTLKLQKFWVTSKKLSPHPRTCSFHIWYCSPILHWHGWGWWKLSHSTVLGAWNINGLSPKDFVNGRINGDTLWTEWTISEKNSNYWNSNNWQAYIQKKKKKNYEEAWSTERSLNLRQPKQISPTVEVTIENLDRSF